MTWVRFEDRFPWHRKVRGLSDAAFRLHVSAVCWSCEHLTDGHVPADDLPLVSDVKTPVKAVRELERKGLWDVEPDGWRVHDFLIYNESRETILARREADAERKRRGRESRKGTGSPSGVQSDVRADAQSDSPAESARTTPARPEPNQQTTTSSGASRKATRIPEVFPPDSETAEALRLWATEHTPAVAIRQETEHWRDWHLAKGDTAKDWIASWRTWMRRAQKDAERGRGPVRPSTTDQRASQGLALVEHFRQQEGA